MPGLVGNQPGHARTGLPHYPDCKQGISGGPGPPTTIRQPRRTPMIPATYHHLLAQAMGLIFLGLGLYCVGVAVRELHRVLKMVLHGSSALGKIVETVEEEDADGRLYHSIIEYKTHTGEVLRVKSPIGWEKPGESGYIEVFYDTDNPERMVENNVVARYGSVTLLVAGALLVYAGLKTLQPYL